MDHRPPAPADPPGRRDDEERPPILGGWSALYGAVITELALVIAFCQWLTGRGR